MTERTTEQEVPLTPPSREKKTGLLVTFAVILALLGLLGWGLRNVQAGPVDSGIAPDFTLTEFDGDVTTLSALRGRVVIINFWASWCIPCRQEAPYLEATYRKYKDQGVVFIGIDYVDTDKEARAYIKEFDITYPNGPDLGLKIAEEYNIKGIPETFYIAKNGEVRGMHIGPLQYPQLDEKIEELLAEQYP